MEIHVSSDLNYLYLNMRLSRTVCMVVPVRTLHTAAIELSNFNRIATMQRYVKVALLDFVPLQSNIQRVRRHSSLSWTQR